MRERVPRPATREWNRAEYIGMIGLALGAVGWLVLLTRRPTDCTTPAMSATQLVDGDPVGIL